MEKKVDFVVIVDCKSLSLLYTVTKHTSIAMNLFLNTSTNLTFFCCHFFLESNARAPTRDLIGKLLSTLLLFYEECEQ